ncbi:dipeptide epimerase [Roseiterribacter gracilis]|uniref:Dipeptide epimerase n=1 Tax=Roseiterribacter gracilis TaxID=2812848 RepID=A0A8S8XBZ1_9PROT|nr:dipeptide epimerase [Rhodospirillales bacterium TMPK1]
MKRRTLDVAIEKLQLKAPFRISGYVFTDVEVVVVRLREGAAEGRGEAGGVYYMKDEPPGMVARIEAARDAIESGISRDALRAVLPPGGARNAVDCAIWELEAQLTNTPVWQMAGIDRPQKKITTFTCGADEPEKMAAVAKSYAQARAIKIKLTGDPVLDGQRVRAIRAARPDVWLGVDGNQGFTRDSLQRLMPVLVEAKIGLLEQPFARGREADHEGLRAPMPVAGDESILSLADVPGAVGRFDVINIKLDKSGGLTEGLLMAREARRLGLKVMVGNMVGSSWAMAPAFVLAQLCDFVDLDAPIFITQDRDPALTYDDGYVFCDETMWGSKVRVPA